MSQIKRASFKELFGWCMFDFANSAYTTVIISVTFGDIFSRIIVPSDPTNIENPYQHGNFLWGLALAISYIIVVILGPIFGAITDYTSKKKLFLFFSYIGCVLATIALWFVDSPGQIALPFILIIFSNLFFASSENFVSSFLPFLGPKDDVGKISGYAWGIGYFGGIASVALVTTLGEVAPENYQSLRLVGPYTGLFFLVAAIPTFLFLKEPKIDFIPQSGFSYLKIGFNRVYETLRSVHKFKVLAIYLLSLFFAMASLGIVISFTFIYGTQEIKVENIHKTVMFLLIQICAALGALSFGLLQDKIGAKKTFNITLIIWLIAVILINQIQLVTEFLNGIGINITIQWLFVGICSIAGLGLGSTQSSSRAIVSILSPESKAGEFFGLWGQSGKLANACGIFLVGWLQTIFSLRNAFLVLGVLFLMSLIINFFVDLEQGVEDAKAYHEK